MRPTHRTITPSFVRSVARKTLSEVLPWKACGRLVTVLRLLSVLLAVAASRRSLSAVVASRSFGFGRETARKAVDANLPDMATLVAGLDAPQYEATLASAPAAAIPAAAALRPSSAR